MHYETTTNVTQVCDLRLGVTFQSHLRQLHPAAKQIKHNFLEHNFSFQQGPLLP
jgi:hypothetical protein